MMFTHLLTFLEKRPLTGKFSKIFSTSIHRDIDPRLVCKYGEIGRQEVGEIVRCSPDKNQNFGSRSRSRFCADRSQNLSWTAPNNMLGVFQISSKSVHFRRSYSRTREHRSNAPQSVSNTRRSYSFFAE